ncbi:MAG: hypothetical protein NC433_13575 [Clostridiales bacterium]|nr:hypothetical protein [Clostridiales bacterium]
MKTDTITKDYVKDTGIFADIFIYYIYDGRQVIRPEQLIERHTAKIAPAQMSDDEIMKFQSSLREVLLFIKYSKDKENLSRVLRRCGKKKGL